VENIINALGIQSSELKAKLRANPRHHRVAPLHFWPSNRCLDENGIWRLKDFEKATTFVDPDKNKWIGFPPPNYKVADFVSNLESASQLKLLPKDRWLNKMSKAHRDRHGSWPWTELTQSLKRFLMQDDS
jgi:hypothetical protein